MSVVVHRVESQNEPPPGDSFPFRLSEGQPDFDPEAGRLPVAETTPLSATELQAVLNRLPEVQREEGDEQEYRLPEETLPAPRPGEEVDLVFPPEESEAAPDTAADAPLEVLRFSPEGDVPIVPQLSVTFNQPMVPLTSHEELAKTDVPVRLTPDVPGHWRWVGTKTLFFEADVEGIDRFPMATEYRAEIPAGVRSATGNELATAVSWSFRTPPPQLQRSHPTGRAEPLTPTLFASFDQRIDPNAVLEYVQLRAGNETIPVRMATEEEITDSVEWLVKNSGEDRWLAFRPTRELPKGTTITVNFLPGTPSAEGPLTTTQTQSFSFQTYGPFLVQEHRCGWNRECPPFTPWEIIFTNPIDADAFDPALIKVEPALTALEIEVYGNYMSLRGNTQGRTDYKVTLSPDLQDIYGQKLGQPVTLTFRVGSAQPYMTAPGGNFIVMDPSGKPTYSVYTVNIGRVNVRAYAVQPEQYQEYLQWLQESWRDESMPTPPGKLVLEKGIDIDGQMDALTETSIDLSQALSNNKGSLILVVQPDPGLLGSLFNTETARRLRSYRAQKFIQVTDIGLDAFVDGGRALVWTNNLSDGAPLGDVQVELWPTGISGRTDETGTAMLDLPATGNGAKLILARRGDDVAFIPYDTYYYYYADNNSGWRQQAQGVESRFFVFDDRAMYRPGDTVHLKGWLRGLGAGPTGDVQLLSADFAREMRYRVYDARGNEFAKGTVPLNSLGGFHFQFDLPTNINLGYANVELTAAGGSLERDYRGSYNHTFQVQEFRRPEFEVRATASEGPHLVGGHAIATVKAAYYAGGPLPGADTNWSVSAASTSYRPPNWSDFTFGAWTPWWRYHSYGYESPSQTATFTSRTDPGGEHHLRIDFEAPNPPLPMTISANATVMDVNRQAWTSGTDLLVHPADRYVGLRTPGYFVERGKPLEIEIAVTDIEGNAITGHPVSVRAARLDWEYKSGSWQEVEKEFQLCETETTNATNPDDPDAEFATCSFRFELGGQVRITATVEDSEGRKNQTELTRWISGGQRPPSRDVEQESVMLIPSADSYQPGDVAEILVQAPFFPAEGLITLRRDGLVNQQRFTLTGPTYTLQLPIEDAYIPNIYLQVDLVGAAPRLDDQGEPQDNLPKRPAYATGQLNLEIPPISRTLTVDAVPAELRLEPGGETTLAVTVTDANGDPVADAELAVVVVDEAILALSNYTLADPVSLFYTGRGAGVADHHNRTNLLLLNPALLQEMAKAGEMALAHTSAMRSAPMPSAMPAAGAVMEESADMAFDAMPAMEMEAPQEAEPGEPIRVRTNFDPLALFAPEVRTDANGQAQLEISLPDNLTRYRIMVVAVAGEKYFGSSEANLTARLPLMVRPSAPRFLNFGDRFELPIVIQNQTDDPVTVDVAVQATNADLTAEDAIAVPGGEAAGQRVTVPANDRVEVRFPTTTARAGTARFQIAGVSGSYADAAEVSLPVYTPATTEAFAVYGEVDDSGSVLQPVLPPANVIPIYGGLEVSMSSTALQALTDAYIYLVQYPFECSEQIASRMLGVAALRDVLSAFDAPGLPSPQEINAAMQRDIQTLRVLQNPNGGFPIWRQGGDIWPYHSVHGAHALARARMKDYAVPEEMIARSLNYLRQIDGHIPYWYSQKSRNSLIAYSLYVRDLLGDVDTGKARQLINSQGLENLSLESIGWLLNVLAGDDASQQQIEAIRRHLNNRVTETAGAANFADSYGDGDYLILYSDRRADAVILEALIEAQPESDLIPKLVRGLLGHRTQGRWGNTQENIWVLLALDSYFNRFEAQTPDFVARVWLGDQYAGSHEFVGRTTETVGINIPMPIVQESREQANEDGTVPLILQKEGQGRLYYRLGMRYAPTDLTLEPADHGFTVERRYEAVDDPTDVRQDEDGVWRIRAGSRVQVKITMVAPSRRYHVALIDPLPAGLEAMNPALAVIGDIPQDPGSQNRYGWWWWGPWYEHQNLRDQRAEAFATLVWGGVYEYSYTARATTPGEFIVPPAKAEEMYSPEVFGRSGTDRVVVE
jgi:alpha-2-macroglobulin